jgi:type II secretion system protein J
VELLIAITISTLLIGSAYGAYLAVSQAWDRSRQASRHYQYARVALDTIQRYLQAAVGPDDSGRVVFEPKNQGVEGKPDYQADSVLFVSTGGRVDPSRANRVDLAQVEFYLNQDPDRPDLGLMMRQRTLPADPQWGHGDADELAPDVASFDVRFFDGAQWVEDWPAGQGLPKAAEVTLVFADPEGAWNPAQFSRLIPFKCASPDTASSEGAAGAGPGATGERTTGAGRLGEGSSRGGSTTGGRTS